MLTELAVSGLGVIADVRLVLGPGMTALTGETGAGKTMLVEALELLVGGRADPVLVRPGAAEAVIEGRFVHDGDELVLSRVVPAEGRSRAYLNGRMATASTLAEVGGGLIDLHGQHDHQSLLAAAVQRDALDRFGEVDLGPLVEARSQLAAIDARLTELGGDAGARAREIDLLRFQSEELAAAGLADPGEDDALDAEEDLLADAGAHRLAALEAAEALGSDGPAGDALARAIATLADRPPFAEAEARLRSVAAELTDVVDGLRIRGEQIEDDPARLDQIRERRALLADLRRKYGTATIEGTPAGSGTLGDVCAYRDHIGARLATLEGYDDAAAELEAQREAAIAQVARAEAAVGRARRAAAPRLADAVQAHLAELAMAGARVSVQVGARDPGDEVVFLLAANKGAPLLPLAKVASGGELARAMLALRLVLSAAPPTLVFDEVDAGIGGTAAIAVGRALASLADDHQVLVVTHLPQVAAFADAQVSVVKADDAGATSARALTLEPEERVVELSRMLSGTPESAAARGHAAELLESAAAERSR